MIVLVISFLTSSLALGDYSETCKDLYLISSTISAKCLDSQNQFTETQIRLRGVNNVNGKLTFLKDTRKKSYFHKECKKTTINTEGVISAECPNAQGKYVLSSLATREVLINDNGSLIYPAQEQLDFVESCNNIRYSDFLQMIFGDCVAENGGRYKTKVKARGISVRNGKLVLTHDGKDYEKILTKYCDSNPRLSNILDAKGNIGARCFKNQSGAEEPTGPKFWSFVNIRSLIVNKNGSLVLIDQE